MSVFTWSYKWILGFKIPPWSNLFQSSLSRGSPYLAHCGSICRLSGVSIGEAIVTKQPPLHGSGLCLSIATATWTICQPDYLTPLCTCAAHNGPESLPGFCSWHWGCWSVWRGSRCSKGCCGPLQGSLLIVMASCLLSPYVVFISVPKPWWNSKTRKKRLSSFLKSMKALSWRDGAIEETKAVKSAGRYPGV